MVESLHVQLPPGATVDDLDAIPGGDLVRKGLRDLSSGAESVEGLLVMVGRPQLVGLGFGLPEWGDEREPASHHLYDLLARDDPDSAHMRYNGLVRRLVSFEQTLSLALRWRDAEAR